MRTALFLCAALVATSLPAADLDYEKLLKQEIIGSLLTQQEAQDYCERQINPIRQFENANDWKSYREVIREAVLDNVVFRGEADKWRDEPLRVEWLDTIAGGSGYRIKKLRYEAVPGLWIPALLYEPEKLTGKVPVSLAVNGHDGKGKAADYKQIRCINQAKRGMLVLNVEWLGMGQLRTPNYVHARMNQLDLCGTSGLAPFYLSMKRGLDVLLSLEHADASRVAVSGLSGGGWQTITISSLDPRVTLANPVAGYSSFRTRARVGMDLGDSEQTPVDLGVFADYSVLTMMRAPRPTLLTFNAHDNCCFQSGHALPPLLDAAMPVYRLFGKENALRWHVNELPGTHNYERNNREAFYRMIGDFFFAGDRSFDPREIPSDVEVKTADELMVPLPEKNEDFNSLALALSRSLPETAATAEVPQLEAQRKKLADTLRMPQSAPAISAQLASQEEHAGVVVNSWRFKIADAWTVPAVEFVPEKPTGCVILLADDGRKSLAGEVKKLVEAGRRVIAVDPFYFGESAIARRGYLYALLISTVGDRPLGVQASQLRAIANWAKQQHDSEPLTLSAVGPRSSVIATVAAALEPTAIAGLELRRSMGSLKEVIEDNRTVDQCPELFCFDLLRWFDIPTLLPLIVPRTVTLRETPQRSKPALAGLSKTFADAGGEFKLE